MLCRVFVEVGWLQHNQSWVREDPLSALKISVVCCELLLQEFAGLLPGQECRLLLQQV